MATIRHVLGEHDGYVPLRIELGRDGLVFLVGTVPTKNDACRGCWLARRTYCDALAGGPPCGFTRRHFKKVREGDILVCESGNRYIVRQVREFDTDRLKAFPDR